MTTPVRKYAYLSWLVLLAGLLLSLHAQADAVARVLFAHGEVVAQRIGDTPRNLARGDELFEQDIVQTGKNSSVQFRFTDGTLFALRGESQFEIEQHRYNEQTPQQNGQSGQLLRGGLRAITGAIARERPEAVQMRTPVATIGIRGTVYETFYIPPEGHPALPGVAPGHYVLVLRGRVAMTNAAGELLLASGEIGYTPNASTRPALRPDLSGLFGRFAALDSEEERLAGQSADGTGDLDTRSIDNALTETAITGQTASPGPFALVVADDIGSSVSGRFINQAVQLDNDKLVSAANGTGSISTFDLVGNPTPTGTGSLNPGDSQIHWGAFSGTDVLLNGTAEADFFVSYITATNVLVTTSDLPTTGSHTYLYQGGSGTSLDGTSALSVDFGDATLSATLSITSLDTWTATAQPIGDFYGNGISLAGGLGGGGTLAGRFVGTNAEGAISYFELNENTTIHTGTAAFTR